MNLNARVVAASGRSTLQPASPAVAPAFDCFYVYPTVSTQRTANANLRVQPAEVGVAVAQAARFSQVCRVWAPMYRQRTAASGRQASGPTRGPTPSPTQRPRRHGSDYLANDNDGRPFIFIGHSQGAAMLIRLVRNVIDPTRPCGPGWSRRSSSAATSRSRGQAGRRDLQQRSGVLGARPDRLCNRLLLVPSRPPAASEVGRPGQGVSLQSGQTTRTGERVLCRTRPPSVAARRSSSPTSSRAAPWPPGPPRPGPPIFTLHSTLCQLGGAAWLQVGTTGLPGDRRPTVTEALGPDWGYHPDDVNLALGNLVADVARQELAYGTRR